MNSGLYSCVYHINCVEFDTSEILNENQITTFLIIAQISGYEPLNTHFHGPVAVSGTHLKEMLFSPLEKQRFSGKHQK